MTNQSGEGDALWVPLLTHYRAGAKSGSAGRVDPERMAAQVRAISPAVRQFLLAGSTGDGWELDFDAFMDIVDLSRRQDVFRGTRILYGVLRPTTEEVVDWAVRLEASLAEDGAPASEYAGLAICPPIDAGANQSSILHHFQAILERTTSPIAVYQLPQVTQCTIGRETMEELALNKRVTMFKDTSGTDTIAQKGPISGVLLVRGAEGSYLESLAPFGGYDGWLLSSGNVFGPALRRILDLHAKAATERARQLSSIVTLMVEALFEAAGNVPFGNPFSNANRAVDHLLATGSSWRDSPLPLTVNGNALPSELISAAEDIIGHLPGITSYGYLGSDEVNAAAREGARS
ncbi:MAG: 4-hydroxy-tetrahydrodipicolinate synthase [Betaproteobacteria bacterium]|jgi:4-hydroxy-tetrahydrodipicolinate synthase|nr:4-hydroxy-tetrahydrodipicolinate synthase [Betaproteobacteria bacterium]